MAYALTPRSKYGNRKTVIDGITFDSAGEARRYQELRLMEAAGDITALILQPRFELQPAFRDRTGMYHRAIEYRADFQYRTADGILVVEDYKGFATKDFRIKAKLFRYRYGDVDLRIVEGR